MDVLSGGFWAALAEIIAINVILSGDNALVIALACRGLPPRERKLGVLFGTLAAIALRILFAAVIVYVLKIPALMLAGSLALMWIAIKLVQPEEGGGHDDGVKASASIWQAVKIVCVADAVMSLDNVIAVAAAAKGDILLLSLGIAISIPPVVLGSTVMLWILDRFPFLVIAGSGLLGYIAGELAVEDKFVHQWIEDHHLTVPAMLPYLTCALVVGIGLWLRRRATHQQESS